MALKDLHPRIQPIVADHIRRFGFFTQSVFARENENPAFKPFLYTVGMFQHFGFEMIVFSGSSFFAGIFLDMYRKMDKGLVLDLKSTDCDLASHPIRFRECNNRVRSHAVQAGIFHGGQVKFIQLVLSDKNRLFKGDPGFDIDWHNRTQKELYD